MTYLTRAQRVTLHRLWKERVGPESIPLINAVISYRSFRKTVEPLIGGQGCVMVCIDLLWFGIEEDGYAHT